MNSKRSYLHQLFGHKKTRITYRKQDGLDYILMNLISLVTVYLVYGSTSPLFWIASICSLFLTVGFPLRHGFQWTIPLLFRRPQDVVYMLIYKVRNIKVPLILALNLLLLENIVIGLTPSWPHHVTFMSQLAFWLFMTHFGVTILFRTIVLFAHLFKSDHVATVLKETPWKNAACSRGRTIFEIFYAYATGNLTHIVYLVPWYLVIQHAKYSLVLMPLIMITNVLIEKSFLKLMNIWFYRDHWLGHHSEIEFIYLHGSHHDAIPSALIGVGDNGHLEGFFRQALGFPVAYYHPISAFIIQTIGSYGNMINHQYIPGVFPKARRDFEMQHSLHHYMRLEPYSVGGFHGGEGLKAFPDELKFALRLDEEMTGYQRDNRHYRWYLSLIEKYEA